MKMEKLVFATNNKHKTQEVLALLNNKFKICTLEEIGFREEIPEEAATLEENARQKAYFIYKKYGLNCFADDTGLEIEALGGAPGVYSARYAGEEKDSNANIEKVLSQLNGEKNRKAAFRTFIILILDGKEYVFEGKVTGTILQETKGVSGFGYDPVFVPDGYNETFAEMPLDLKNKISHRGLAIKKLVTFLNKKYNE
ncbi:MAG: non-canonical purine NTP diphosphatase [Candidatus Azobacteroides sp.]|nr:non-canonical purine NTP diphosphatase [Candidatus Azobacteroides sp.]